MVDFDIDTLLLRRDVPELGRDLRIVRVHNAAANQLDHVGAFPIEQGLAGSQLLEFGAPIGDRSFAPVEPRLEQRGEPFGFEHAINKRVDYDPVELVHSHPATDTLTDTGVRSLVADIIGVAAALAGASRHAAATAIAATSADDMTSQQIGVGLYSGPAHARIARRHLCLRGIEQIVVNDRGDGNWHPFVLGTRFPSARVAFVVHDHPDVRAVGENGVDI